jgi:hypothetical protein
MRVHSISVTLFQRVGDSLLNAWLVSKLSSKRQTFLKQRMGLGVVTLHGRKITSLSKCLCLECDWPRAALLEEALQPGTPFRSPTLLFLCYSSTCRSNTRIPTLTARAINQSEAPNDDPSCTAI